MAPVRAGAVPLPDGRRARRRLFEAATASGAGARREGHGRRRQPLRHRAGVLGRGAGPRRISAGLSRRRQDRAPPGGTRPGGESRAGARPTRPPGPAPRGRGGEGAIGGRPDQPRPGRRGPQALPRAAGAELHQRRRTGPARGHLQVGAGAVRAGAGAGRGAGQPGQLRHAGGRRCGRGHRHRGRAGAGRLGRHAGRAHRAGRRARRGVLGP